jgi:hypothetical protein
MSAAPTTSASLAAPIYSYVKLSDFDLGWVRLGPGPGLGNLLFPWARSIVARKQYGLTPLATTWPQLKIGPILRREPDKRFYIGCFHAARGELRGVRRQVLLSTAQRVDERTFEAAPQSIRAKSVVVYSGLGGQFAPLLGEAELIREALLAIVRPKHLRALELGVERAIGLHVRLGDFQPENPADLRRGHTCTRQPLSWYCHALDLLTEALPESRVLVFSDGTDAELAPILTRPNVARFGFGSAIGDLLAMSTMRVFVGSASTFSKWASFLGRMPVIWYPGQLQQRLYLDHPDLEIELDDSGSLPDVFVNALRSESRSTFEMRASGTNGALTRTL